jgi:5-methylcytosine-specific restriction endonuclease McrA
MIPITEHMKTCGTCKKEFPASTEYFSKNKPGLYGLHSICKECRSKKAREWREANPERHAKNSRDWQRNNPEKTREKSKRYRVRHPKKILEYAERHRKSHREYYREYARKYRLENPEWSYQTGLIRRARKVAAGGHHTYSDVKKKYETQGKRCYWCGCELNGTYHADHYIPLSRGGSNAIENIVIACPACNLSKKDRLPYIEWKPQRVM